MANGIQAGWPTVAITTDGLILVNQTERRVSAAAFERERATLIGSDSLHWRRGVQQVGTAPDGSKQAVYGQGVTII